MKAGNIESLEIIMRPGRLCLKLGIALAGMLSQSVGATTDNTAPIIEILMDTRPCVFFRLNGVAVADPSAGTTSWYALPKSSPMFAEQYTLLLTYKASQKPIRVVTDGTSSCGHTTVVALDVT